MEGERRRVYDVLLGFLWKRLSRKEEVSCFLRWGFWEIVIMIYIINQSVIKYNHVGFSFLLFLVNFVEDLNELFVAFLVGFLEVVLFFDSSIGNLHFAFLWRKYLGSFSLEEISGWHFKPSKTRYWRFFEF